MLRGAVLLNPGLLQEMSDLPVHNRLNYFPRLAKNQRGLGYANGYGFFILGMYKKNIKPQLIAYMPARSFYKFGKRIFNC